ncbi:MAG TPA: transporter [Clostridia bacterium]|nr:transporter [Clostridia bacterium]
MRKTLLLIAVNAALAIAALAGEPAGAGASATTSAAATAPAKPIQDNSFLIEEAYNQEDGVIQHISFFQRLANSKDWVYTMTDEWPLRTQKHQLSFTVSAAHVGGTGGSGWGDTAINYRYQAIGSGDTKLAFSPRLSLLMPTGDSKVGRGYGGTGLQANLPVSYQFNNRLVTHWNAGATWVPRTKNELGEKAGTVGVNLGQSSIWLVSKNFNAMLETAWYSNESVIGAGRTDRAQDIFISPGVRWAHNFESGLQIVPGVAIPVGVGPSSGEKGVIFYLSLEHPFGFASSGK